MVRWKRSTFPLTLDTCGGVQMMAVPRLAHQLMNSSDLSSPLSTMYVPTRSPMRAVVSSSHAWRMAKHEDLLGTGKAHPHVVCASTISKVYSFPLLDLVAIRPLKSICTFSSRRVVGSPSDTFGTFVRAYLPKMQASQTGASVEGSRSIPSTCPWVNMSATAW